MASLTTKAELADEQTGGKDTDSEDDALLNDVNDDDLPLAQLFHEARAITQRLAAGDELLPPPSSSGRAPRRPLAARRQDPVARALEVLDKCALRLRRGGTFSANEELDDVKTADLPYLLLEHVRAQLLPQSAAAAAAAAGPGGLVPPFDPRARLGLLRASCKAHAAFLAQCDALGAVDGTSTAIRLFVFILFF